MKHLFTALRGVAVMLGVAAAASAQVAEPRIIPAFGPPFYAPLEIVIESETPAVTIYYTVDGSAPSIHSDAYDPSSPILLDAGTNRVMAIAYDDQGGNSAIASETFVVLPEQAAPPVFDPPGGFFFQRQRVEVTTPTDGAVIYYTLDGSVPTRDSLFWNPGHSLVLRETTTIKAFASAEGMTDSEVVTLVFFTVAVADLQNGETVRNLDDADGDLYFRIDVPPFATSLQVTISGGTGDADLIVKYNGLPSPTDYDYYPRFEGNEETVFITDPEPGEWFILLTGDPGGFDDVELQAVYEGSAPTVARPVITPGGGRKIGRVLVTMQVATPGAVIRYTLDNTEPTEASASYTGPFLLAVKPKVIVRARGFREGYAPSSTAREKYRMAKRVRKDP